MKKLVSFLISFILLCSFVPSVQANDDIPVYFNGVLIEKHGTIISDRTYLPVRALCEKIGISVDWIDETKSVILGTAPLSTEKGSGVNIYLNAVKLENSEAVILEDSTYLPVRALCEALGMNVKWKAATREVFVSSLSDAVSDFISDEGFLALDPHTRERYIAAISSPTAIGQAFTQTLTKSIPSDYFNLALDEKTILAEEFITKTPYYRTQIGRISSDEIASYKINSITYKESHDVWRGDMQPVWVYSVTMDASAQSAHEFEFISTVRDDEFAKTVLNALARFPYPVRRLVTKITNAPSGNNTYYGGGSYIWIKLSYLPDEDRIAQDLSCVLGFILHGASKEKIFWANAIKDDVIPLSDFALTNATSDFGEFTTLFFNMKDTEGGLEALERVYPNRFRAFAAMLYSCDTEYYAEYKTYYDALYSASEQEDAKGGYFTISIPFTKLYLTHDIAGDGYAHFEEFTGADNQLWTLSSIGESTVIKSKASGMLLSPQKEFEDFIPGGIYMADPNGFFSSEADGHFQNIVMERQADDTCTIYFTHQDCYLGQDVNDPSRPYPVSDKTNLLIKMR